MRSLVLTGQREGFLVPGLGAGVVVQVGEHPAQIRKGRDDRIRPVQALRAHELLLEKGARLGETTLSSSHGGEGLEGHRIGIRRAEGLGEGDRALERLCRRGQITGVALNDTHDA